MQLHVVAFIIAACGAAWYWSTQTPLLLLALLFAIDAYNGVHVLWRRSGLQPVSRPLSLAYEITLEFGDDLWKLLGLTEDEQNLVRASPPPRFLRVEYWARAKIEWRVFTPDGDRAREAGIHVYASEEGALGTPDEGIVLWRVVLGAGLHAPSVLLRWENDCHLVVGVEGGRFGEEWGGGSTEFSSKPKPEHSILVLHPPVVFPASTGGGAVSGFVSDVDEFTPWEGDHFRSAERDDGVKWWLTVYDLQYRFDVEVKRVHKTLWRREVHGVTLRYRGVGGTVRVGAPALAKSRIDGKRIQRGHQGWLILNDDGDVDRLHFYGISVAQPRSPQTPARPG